MMKKIAAFMFGAAMLLATATPALAHPPLENGFFQPPGDIDLCNATSIESHAEYHSNGHADNGFDHIGYPGVAGRSGKDPLHGNECLD